MWMRKQKAFSEDATRKNHFRSFVVRNNFVRYSQCEEKAAVAPSTIEFWADLPFWETGIAFREETSFRLAEPVPW